MALEIVDQSRLRSAARFIWQEMADDTSLTYPVFEDEDAVYRELRF